MNAAIRGATVACLALGHEPIGVQHGYRGLVSGAFVPLDTQQVTDALRRGGTVLESARCVEFHEPAVRQKARDVLTDAAIDGLIVIGGNGSLQERSISATQTKRGTGRCESSESRHRSTMTLP